ncbi:MaoC/PaaZ C-terminal domain-containing protein [Haloarchaeobius sp. TZWSO28]|uniref:MaoC/PaaZ C-terminal domain-containing protein n=1 Tax=unclassified Haloarchaeobius TaxID=2614452 RepID=UPI003EB9AB0C
MPYSYQPHHYEDFEVGQEFVSVGRTITESDLVDYASLGGDWTELHTNKEYAQEQHFGQRVAHGPLTLTIAMGLAARCGFMERTVMGFLGIERMDFPQPVFIGDTLSAEFTVTDLNELESRDDAGVVALEFDVENQEQERVFDSEMKFLVARD